MSAKSGFVEIVSVKNTQVTAARLGIVEEVGHSADAFNSADNLIICLFIQQLLQRAAPQQLTCLLCRFAFVRDFIRDKRCVREAVPIRIALMNQLDQLCRVLFHSCVCHRFHRAEL
ncbi:MAG: hypothetical protein M9941_00340 [Anaerolineae bacterium]|nr:hypothetical protein [Anaerolineae bacterium]